ncbi:MAG: hypothetical protein M3457_08755 [Chloroflexota bacterium]|nr:hypothetical protein [Chloroflexota bacterium]
MDVSTRIPRRPATRLDVQRHYLEDKRASYAHLEANAHTRESRGNREGRLTAALRSIRASVANLLIAVSDKIRPQPISDAGSVTGRDAESSRA